MHACIVAVPWLDRVGWGEGAAACRLPWCTLAAQLQSCPTLASSTQRFQACLGGQVRGALNRAHRGSGLSHPALLPPLCRLVLQSAPDESRYGKRAPTAASVHWRGLECCAARGSMHTMGGACRCQKGGKHMRRNTAATPSPASDAGWLQHRGLQPRQPLLDRQ